jgi:NADH-quinone oxidoreductase subunit L
MDLNSLIIVLPLIGSALIGLTGFLNEGFRKQESLIGWLASAMVIVPFILVVMAFLSFDGQPIDFALFSWMESGSLNIRFSYRLDELSILMALVVTGVGGLIHVYSIGYMHGDPGYYKFFSYLNLFIFSMNNLILGDNMVVTFLGWEGVGLCSYLLIGFWYTDMMKAKAAQKAFVANRIGDFAMIVAMMLVFMNLDTFNYSDINEAARNGAIDSNTNMWIALLVFIAATGKSAQIPLFVWLPDAMAGPTPVSALIHAATMVTSGIYLIARIHPIFLNSPEIMVVVVVVAALTALLAALIAIAQNDIKGVLAYSTVSQLGFMFMALGAGAFTTAIFHVMTHAFFKACLFLGSGSVIHAMEHMHTVKDPQDIRTMGGLGKYMPSTRTTFWISTLAISGIPIFSGFFSKDEILSSLFFAGYDNWIYYVIWGVAVLTAAMTAFYMTRVTFLTFNGDERFPSEKQPHESSALMTIPLWVLAGLATVGGFLGFTPLFGHPLHIPHLLNDSWLGADGAASAEGLIQNSTVMLENLEAHHNMEWLLVPLSILIAAGMVYFAYNFYKRYDLEGDDKVRRFFGGMYEVMKGKFFVDELYDATIIRPFVWAGKNIILWFDQNIIDGLVNGTANVVSSVGEVFRRLQTGLVSNYVLMVSIGVIVVLTYLIFG